MFLSVSGPGDSTLARRKACAHLRVNIDVVYVALASSPAYLSKVGEFEVAAREVPQSVFDDDRMNVTVRLKTRRLLEHDWV
jgi:hypothetical protein